MTMIEMQKLDEEVVTPERFLRLSNEEKRNIKNIKIKVGFENIDNLNDSEMVSFVVKWKIPKYITKF